MISEPGTDPSEQKEWDGKLVFVEGIEEIIEAVQLYTRDDEGRKVHHLASLSHAREHYKFENYLSDILS